MHCNQQLFARYYFISVIAAISLSAEYFCSEMTRCFWSKCFSCLIQSVLWLSKSLLAFLSDDLHDCMYTVLDYRRLLMVRACVRMWAAATMPTRRKRSSSSAICPERSTGPTAATRGLRCWWVPILGWKLFSRLAVRRPLEASSQTTVSSLVSRLSRRVLNSACIMSHRLRASLCYSRWRLYWQDVAIQ